MDGEFVPPLPDLSIAEMTKRVTDQETIDRIVKFVYECQPEFFPMLAEREGKQGAGPRDPVAMSLHSFIQEQVGKHFDISRDGVAVQIFWEIRRRAMLMYNLYV